MALATPERDLDFQAPEFTLKDPSGRSYSMSEQMGENGLVVMFLCNHCPYVKAVAGRLAEDAAEMIAHGVNVLAIMSNDYGAYPDDSPEKMEAFAKAHRWPFPYLVDEDQSVAKAYGAVCTPDIFGFDKDGVLQYSGRLDDAGRASEAPDRRKELVEAMLQVAKTGKGPREQVPSMGCSIKWKHW